MLQSAIARGADRAIKITTSVEGPLSSRAAAPIIAAAIRQLGVELVLTGVQTPEDLFGQLAPYLGAILDWPHVSAVSSIQSAGECVEVLQEYSGGVSSRLRLSLPAVIGVQTASQPPRYVSGSKLRQSMNETIAVIESDVQPATDAAEILTLREPTRSSEAVMLDGDAEAVADKIHALLAERGLVKA
jgi:electron transfer flavoprotein beta subunit